MRKILYLGLDAHTSHCVLGGMDANGERCFVERFPTSEVALIRHVKEAAAQVKLLALEESAIAHWIARTLAPYVEELIVCDPRQNALISRSSHKDDYQDATRLCTLLRLGVLKPVYHPDQDHRARFKKAVQQYLDFRRRQVRLKQKIKAHYHGTGVMAVQGQQLYGPPHRDEFLALLPNDDDRALASNLYLVPVRKYFKSLHNNQLYLPIGGEYEGHISDLDV